MNASASPIKTIGLGGGVDEELPEEPVPPDAEDELDVEVVLPPVVDCELVEDESFVEEVAAVVGGVSGG